MDWGCLWVCVCVRVLVFGQMDWVQQCWSAVICCSLGFIYTWVSTLGHTTLMCSFQLCLVQSVFFSTVICSFLLFFIFKESILMHQCFFVLFVFFICTNKILRRTRHWYCKQVFQVFLECFISCLKIWVTWYQLYVWQIYLWNKPIVNMLLSGSNYGRPETQHENRFS